MAQPVSLVLGPTETPAIRCKKCKVPLPDATRKNCDRCRRDRTENYHRWKRSVEARKNHIALPTLETHHSSAPPSKLNIRWTKPATTSAPGPHLSHPGTSTPAQHSDATASLPRVNIPEYQWGEELVDALLALPPRSNFFGQFSVIADPDVNNTERAQMFRDQLRSKDLPISDTQKPVSHNPGAPRGHAIGLYCRCEIGCQGRVVVSVDDDTTHPHGVPGQRIGVALLHTSSG